MKLATFLVLAALLVGAANATDDRFCDVAPNRAPLEMEPLNPALKIPRPEMVA